MYLSLQAIASPTIQSLMRVYVPVSTGYCEPVDQTPLVSARLSFKDRAILALPSNDKAGHSCGGVYAFRVGAVGDLKLKAGPPSGVAAFDVHPKLGFIVGACVRVGVRVRGEGRGGVRREQYAFTRGGCDAIPHQPLRTAMCHILTHIRCSDLFDTNILLYLSRVQVSLFEVKCGRCSRRCSRRFQERCSLQGFR